VSGGVSTAAVNGIACNETKTHETVMTNGTLANIQTRHFSNAIRSVTICPKVSDKQLLDGLKEREDNWNLKEEAFTRTLENSLSKDLRIG
jgi:hypothetical protein